MAELVGKYGGPYHYEWEITRLGFVDWRWDMYNVYESGVKFIDGHGYAMTKWGAERGIQNHFEKRVNPPPPKEFERYSGRLG